MQKPDRVVNNMLIVDLAWTKFYISFKWDSIIEFKKDSKAGTDTEVGKVDFKPTLDFAGRRCLRLSIPN